jgi:hypothetical protein
MQPEHYTPILDMYAWKWIAAKHDGRKEDTAR